MSRKIKIILAFIGILIFAPILGVMAYGLNNLTEGLYIGLVLDLSFVLVGVFYISINYLIDEL